MKNLKQWMMMLCAMLGVSLGQEERVIVLPPSDTKPVPVFHSGVVESELIYENDDLLQTANLKIRIVQGKAERLRYSLRGEGAVELVQGSELASWSVTKSAEGKRFLELSLKPRAEGQAELREANFQIKIRENLKQIPANLALTLIGQGEAVSVTGVLRWRASDAVELQILSSEGISPIKHTDAQHALGFHYSGEPTVQLAVISSGLEQAIEFQDLSIAGIKLEQGMDLVVTGRVRVREAGKAVRIFSGLIAPKSLESPNARLIAQEGNQYLIEYSKVGEFPLKLELTIPDSFSQGANLIGFQFAPGAVVPMTLSGLDADVQFQRGTAMVPRWDGEKWSAFLPANGQIDLRWVDKGEADGKLFFTTEAINRIQVGAGLMRQNHQLVYRVLQGELKSPLKLEILGPGQILDVSGAAVRGWKLVEEGEQRFLELSLSEAITSASSVVVTSQTSLANFPTQSRPLLLTPVGAVRHSGFVGVVNDGAVKLGLTDLKGLTQLAPEQFPGGAKEGVRQFFAYRYPSETRGFVIKASTIEPLVKVREQSVVEFGESDRVLSANLELDIREAALREFVMSIPEDYSVVALNGAAVADYVVAGEAREGRRELRVVFKNEAMGRQLIQLRLEKNQGVSVETAQVPGLRYEGVESVRGELGIASAAGFRIEPGEQVGLRELALGLFSLQSPGLQQAYRIREADWSTSVKIEALPQSVQADLFHLYTLKKGVAYGAVLVNYLVIGAPVSEWELEVPESLVNLTIDGQSVRSWRREGDKVKVELESPALGSHTLLLTFERPLASGNSELQLGDVVPLGVQSERGFLQMVSPTQVKHSVTQRDPGLLSLEASELPAEFRVLSSSPSLAAWQYSARPLELKVGLEWYEPGGQLAQVLDFASLESEVATDGQVVTSVKYFVKSLGNQLLRLRLPEGAELWEVQVAGERVNARIDGGQLLIPLPSQTDVDSAVPVTLRYGQPGESGTKELTAPIADAPILASSWTLRGEAGKLLVPKGGVPTASQALTETGFEWLSQRASWAGSLILFAVLVLGCWIASLTKLPIFLRSFGFFFTLIPLLAWGAMAGGAMLDRSVNQQSVEYQSAYLGGGESFVIKLAAESSELAMISFPGIALLLIGGIAFLASWIKRFLLPGLRIAAWILLAIGLLMQRGGAVGFYLLLGLFALVEAAWPALRTIIQSIRNRPKPQSTPNSNPPAPGASVALLIGLLGSLLVATPQSQAAETKSQLASVKEQWLVKDKRIYAEATANFFATTGQTLPLLEGAAVLTKFEGDGVKLRKVALPSGGVRYLLAAEREGELQVKFRYELPVNNMALRFNSPIGATAIHQMRVEFAEGGWQAVATGTITSRRLTGLAEGRSGSELFMGANGAGVISFQPSTDSEQDVEAKFFVEVVNLFEPKPGVVDARHLILVRPSVGKLEEVKCLVPAGFTVSQVGAGVSTWRFDPDSRELTLKLDYPRSSPFSISILSQLPMESLPGDVSFEPLRVNGADGELGLIGLAMSEETQPENLNTEGLSPVAIGDLVARFTNAGEKVAQPRQAYRYGSESAEIKLTVAPVAPDIRVTTEEVLSLGLERTVLGVKFDVTIARSGVFTLAFPMPDGFELESLSGPALSDWVEESRDGKTFIRMQLNGKTLGAHTFNASFAGPGVSASPKWRVPRFQLEEARRQNGSLLLSPERGLRVRSVNRQHVSRKETRGRSQQNGAVAFRLLRQEWELDLAIERLDAWVTAQVLQECQIREGLARHRVAIDYQIENATLRQLQVRLPGLAPAEVQTLRASGRGVADLVQVPGETDLWSIKLERAEIGSLFVEIEWQRISAGEGQSQQLMQPVELIGARVQRYLLAARSSGRLDLSLSAGGDNWQRADWSSVQRKLIDPQRATAPSVLLSSNEAAGPVTLAVQRHAVANALKLQVISGELVSAFMPDQSVVTSLGLQVQVIEKSLLKVELPEGAQLFHVHVNSESVSVVREGNAYLFYVLPGAEEDEPSQVQLAFAKPLGDGGVQLEGPKFNVPLQNIDWKVVLPPGYELSDYDGTLKLKAQEQLDPYELEDYLSFTSSLKMSREAIDNKKLEKANRYLQEGDQKKASKVLSNLTRSGNLDAATNEDARVQLRELKREQAIIGLNTRRQRFYLDNSGKGQNEPNLNDQAAFNGLLQGKDNYDPELVDQITQGNSAEENSTLRRLADRIVNQQLAIDPVPQMLKLDLPERGVVHAFHRGLQIDGNQALSLELDVDQASGGAWWIALGIALLLGLCLAAVRRFC